MSGPRRLVEWPWVTVEVECPLCGRAGCYRLARLAERFGAAAELGPLLNELAAACGLPKFFERTRQYEARCGARFRVPPGGPVPDGVPAREVGPVEAPVAPRRRRGPDGPPPTVGWALAEGHTSVRVHCIGRRADGYTIISSGGEISLRFFGAKETREGVTAKVLGERKVFAGTFMKAGSFAKGRVEKPGWNRQVFRRDGTLTDGYRPGGKRHMDRFVNIRSGVVIPREMVKGEPLRAFETVSEQFPGFVLRCLSEVQLQRQARGVANYGRARVL